jgi:DNA-directed RNA polymerase subunit N (RpoN/RPB10)
MRLVPPRCFNCNRVLNNIGITYHTLVDVGASMDAMHAYLGLGPEGDCCRVTLRTACIEPRLRPPLPVSHDFVEVHEASKLAAATQTLRANGCTEPV